MAVIVVGMKNTSSTIVLVHLAQSNLYSQSASTFCIMV